METRTSLYGKESILDKIQNHWRNLIKDMKAMWKGLKKVLIAAGIVTSLTLFFTGHFFSAIVVGGITYFFWRNTRGEDELVGSHKI